MPAPGSLRVLELYCGIGGCAAALASADTAAEVVAAIDVNHLAVEIYRHNFPHPAAVRTLESLTAGELAAFGADLWWLSPPCQPFTRRGLGRDLADPRTASLLALIDRIGELPPRLPRAGERPRLRRLGDPRAPAGGARRRRLRGPRAPALPHRAGRPQPPAAVLPAGVAAGVRERLARGERRRPAAPTGHSAGPHRQPSPRPLATYLDPEPAPELTVAPDLLARYAGALDLVDPADPTAVAACFTAAYGRSPVRSGSYLILARGSGRPPRGGAALLARRDPPPARLPRRLRLAPGFLPRQRLAAGGQQPLRPRRRHASWRRSPDWPALGRRPLTRSPGSSSTSSNSRSSAARTNTVVGSPSARRCIAS